MEDKVVEYLGDGLYAKIEHGQLVLLANSHVTPSDTVYLEPEVLNALLDYLKR